MKKFSYKHIIIFNFVSRAWSLTIVNSISSGKISSLSRNILFSLNLKLQNISVTMDWFYDWAGIKLFCIINVENLLYTILNEYKICFIKI